MSRTRRLNQRSRREERLTTLDAVGSIPNGCLKGRERVLGICCRGLHSTETSNAFGPVSTCKRTRAWTLTPRWPQHSGEYGGEFVRSRAGLNGAETLGITGESCSGWALIGIATAAMSAVDLGARAVVDEPGRQAEGRGR